MNLLKLAALACLVGFAGSGLWADDTSYINTTQLLFINQSLAASASATATVNIGKVGAMGLSWSISTTGTPAVTAALRWGNGDVYVVPVSVQGVAFTTQITMPTAAGLSDIVAPPASEVRVTITNTGPVPATATVRLFRQ